MAPTLTLLPCVLILCQLSGIQLDVVSFALPLGLMMHFSAGSQVESPPSSQEVSLNRNASFTCITMGLAKWVINGSHTETKTTIYPADRHTQLKNRGFLFLNQQLSNNSFNYTVIVLGSFQNNNTEVDCQIFSSTSLVPTTTPALLTVIGMLAIIICNELNTQKNHKRV